MQDVEDCTLSISNEADKVTISVYAPIGSECASGAKLRVVSWEIPRSDIVPNSRLYQTLRVYGVLSAELMEFIPKRQVRRLKKKSRRV